MHCRIPNSFARSCFLLLTHIATGAYAQSPSLPELLDSARVGLYAEGLSYRLQAEVYQSTSTSAWEPGLYERFEIITDGVRTKVDTQRLPDTFGENPRFSAQDVEVFDGEVYKSLSSVLRGEDLDYFGAIRPDDVTGRRVGDVLIGKRYLSSGRDSLLDTNVGFVPDKNLYRIKAIPENGAYIVFWFDPARGYSVVRKEFFMNDTLRNFSEIELAQEQGVWAPIEIRYYDMNNANPQLAKVTKLVHLELDPEIDPADFELVIPEEARVRDLTKDRKSPATKRTRRRMRPVDMDNLSKDLVPSDDVVVEESGEDASNKQTLDSSNPQESAAPSGEHSGNPLRAVYWSIVGVAVVAAALAALWIRSKSA